jgi:hypothetical protein
MLATIKRRLDRIEKEMPKPATAQHGSAAPLLAARLASMGIVRGSNESLAETTARAMGISMPGACGYQYNATTTDCENLAATEALGCILARSQDAKMEILA